MSLYPVLPGIFLSWSFLAPLGTLSEGVRTQDVLGKFRQERRACGNMITILPGPRPLGADWNEGGMLTGRPSFPTVLCAAP